MATAVSICSNALLQLGASTIADLSEDTDRARLCANLYPTLKAAVLRNHPWNCAIRRVILSPNVTVPEFGWSYRFQLPAEWLRTLDVTMADGQALPYQSEGTTILANANAVHLRYVADLSEHAMDSKLVDVLELALAARLAYPITQSASMAQTKQVEYEQALIRARAIDGMDDQPLEFPMADLLMSRY